MRHRQTTCLLLLVALAACGDLSTEPSRVPDRLRVVPDTVVLTQGEAADLAIEVLDRDGRPFDVLPAWAEPSWSASSAAHISLLGDRVEALAPGAATAEATLAGLTGASAVLVNPLELNVDIAAAYLTQATQRPDGSVPLVAGRDALLRVFLRGGVDNFFRPAVRAILYGGAAAADTFRLERETLGVPVDMRREELTASWNVEIPGALLEPGAQLVVEADPDGVVPLAAGSTLRLPEQGRLDLDVVEVPDFLLRYVPVHLTKYATTGTLRPADPDSFSLRIYERFPLAGMDVDVRDEVFYSDADVATDEGASDLLYEIWLLRFDDDSDRYYYGVVDMPGNAGFSGIGYVGYPAAYGEDDNPGTAAHEIGHNVSLEHAPCGDPAHADRDFPYAGASIGTVGYGIAGGRVYDPATWKDLMSYCGPRWISDYHYEKALAFRDANDGGMTALRAHDRGRTRDSAPGLDALGDGGTEAGADTGLRREVLVLWGGATNGRLTLEPAFRFDAPVALPDSAGPYRIEGYAASGARLFALSFAGRAVDHQPGGMHFVFGIPLDAADLDRLNQIRLTGPEGTVERTARTRPGPRPVLSTRRSRRSVRVEWPSHEYPAALIRDRATGRLIGIDRDGRFERRTRTAGVEVLLSDGVRTVRRRVH